MSAPTVRGRSLRTLYLMPTQRCNCACSYCYVRGSALDLDGDRAAENAALERFLDAVDAADAAGMHGAADPPQVRFLGGEPYLELDAVRDLVARFFARAPHGLAVVNTNGTLVDDEAAAAFMPYGDRLVHVVSLDGLAHAHDARRRYRDGGGTFLDAVRGIRALTNAGLPVYCNMVLDETSVAELEPFFQFVRGGLGLDALSVSLRSGGEPLTVDEEFLLLERAYRAAGAAGLSLTGHHRLHLAPWVDGLRCRAGERTTVVAADGLAYPCQRFVGREQGTAWTDGSAPAFGAAPGTGDSFVDDHCYGPASRALGEMLADLYRREYPEYLAVRGLDRVLFGVI